MLRQNLTLHERRHLQKPPYIQTKSQVNFNSFQFFLKLGDLRHNHITVNTTIV